MTERDYWPTQEWRTCEPRDAGMDAGPLAELASTIRAAYTNLNGILIVRSGNIVYENYFNRHASDDVYDVASVTKSFTSALIGMAIEAGLIPSVDARVLDFFPDYVPDATERQKSEITIRHLLTMTVPYPFPDWHEPLDRMRRQADWVKFALDMMGQGGLVGPFKYSTSGAHLLSAILTRVTGMSAREFANERLFRLIGMREIPDNPGQTFGLQDVFSTGVKGWVHDPAGNSTGGFGLTLTLRDMARFGYLYLNGGCWDGKQVVPESWVKESWQPAVAAIKDLHYGYLWWLGEENGLPIFTAMGDGGNMICCVPEKDLVVVVASRIVRNARNRMELVRKFVLPALRE